MRVLFERVDARRYLIGAVRDGRYDVGADVPVRPAPGTADVPHDLVHFAVEETLGLRLGIYGQLAAGGDVGGFFRPAPADRRPALDRKRSDRVGRAGRPEVAVSERIAGLAYTGVVRGEDERLDPRTRAALVTRLDDLLGRWRAVRPGARLVLPWPEHLQIRHGVLPKAVTA